MRPRPLELTPLESDPRFLREGATGLVWHRTSTRVIYADTDRSGAVYHSNYLKYFEIGRGDLMRDLGFPYAEIEARGYVYPIVDMRLSFHRWLEYDQAIRILTRPSELERVKVTFQYILTLEDEPQVVCRGYTTHCALNQNRVPVAVDETTARTWRDFPR